MDSQRKQIHEDVQKKKKQLATTNYDFGRILKTALQHPEIQKSPIFQADPFLLKCQGKYSPYITLTDFEILETLKTRTPDRPLFLASHQTKKVTLQTIQIADQKAKQMFLEHLEMICSFVHPSVLSVSTFFFESMLFPSLACVVTPFCVHGNLREFTSKTNPNSWKLIQIFGHVLEGIRYLHEAGIVHCNLIPESILVNESEDPVIADFEKAKLVRNAEWSTHSFRDFSGIPPFYWPDEFFSHSFHFKTDLYSFSVCMLQLLGKMDCSKIFNPNQLRERVELETFDVLVDFKPFVEKCIAKDLSQRYSAPEALGDPFWETIHFFKETFPGRWRKVKSSLSLSCFLRPNFFRHVFRNKLKLLRLAQNLQILSTTYLGKSFSRKS